MFLKNEKSISMRVFLLITMLKIWDKFYFSTSIKLIFKKIIHSLHSGNNVELRGFGTLRKKINKEKYVRNPKTNEKIYKPQNYKIHFKIGRILHQRINPN